MPIGGAVGARLESGFTLIEMLVVVVVLSILAAVALPRLGGFREQAHLSAITSDFRNLGIHQELYRAVHQTYASDLSELEFMGSDGVLINVVEATASGWAAIGTHQGLPSDAGCAVFLGDADAPSLPDGQPHTGGSGVVQCRR